MEDACNQQCMDYTYRTNKDINLYQQKIEIQRLSLFTSTTTNPPHLPWFPLPSPQCNSYTQLTQFQIHVVDFHYMNVDPIKQLLFHVTIGQCRKRLGPNLTQHEFKKPVQSFWDLGKIFYTTELKNNLFRRFEDL